MADGKVQLEVVIPSRILLSEEADMVVVPGGDGDFGVLPGHAPLLSTIRPGVLDVYRNNVVTDRLFVAGGFAEVSPEGGCTVLAEEAIALADIDRQAAEERLAKAREAHEHAEEDRKAATERALRTAEAYVVAAESVRGRAA